MLLRSSSTPILGSLLSSNSTPYFSESPNTHHHTSFSCHLGDASDHNPQPSGVRRSRSDGNLHSLLSDATGDSPHPHHHHHHHPPLPTLRCSRRTSHALESIPSFSVYNPTQVPEESEQDEQDEEEELDEDEVPPMPVKAAGEIEREFSFSGGKQDVGFEGNAWGSGNVTSPLFLARGLGIDRLGSGLMNASGGGGGGGGNGGGYSDTEMYYKRMVEENPSNAMFLSNYAQFLYQSKGDAKRAEEYYSRAILAEPGDGEILSQYAKLVWELHGDEERASSYFEQAVQAAPQDSRVLAAYAGFLWEAEDEDGVGAEDAYLRECGGLVHQGALASASN